MNLFGLFTFNIMESISVLILIASVVFFLTNKRMIRRAYISLRNLPRDIWLFIVMLKINAISQQYLKKQSTVYGEFNNLVKLHPQKVALYFEDQVWTYSQMEALCNKVSKYFVAKGYNKGDIVALMLDNCPEYHCIILGLSRLGIVTALINTNLKKNLLLHSVTVIKPRGFIFDKNYSEEIEEMSHDFEGIDLYLLQDDAKDNSVSFSIQLKKELAKISDEPLTGETCKLSSKDPVVYIYTSGTTGLPKASVTTHARFLVVAKCLAVAVGITKNDVVYSPLPLYHAGGGLAGVGQAIICGTTTVIRKKFSASHYFKDCVKYNVTVGQYIGEMCRYILVAYNQIEPEKHQVRTMFGNGLNPLVWDKFVTKFSIKNIVEVYGSTEGVALLMNLTGKLGSIGYIPSFLKKLNIILLIKCDKSGEPIRDKSGLCIKCDVNEPGLILGKVNSEHAVFDYKGYTDNNATEKKVLRDVVVKGDVYYNSGDVLVYDEFGYFYFKDRMGDTFRWKGENVSTYEVESVISSLVNLKEVIVYGVEIPQTEGRVGMAAIVDPSKKIDFQSLGNALKSNLPGYAIPLFIRILNSPPLTGTFKLQKVKLRDEGYNINIITDSLYFYDFEKNSFVNFTRTLYDDILNNRLRL